MLSERMAARRRAALWERLAQVADELQAVVQLLWDEDDEMAVEYDSLRVNEGQAELPFNAEAPPALR